MVGNVAETLFSPVKFSSGGEFAYQKWVIDICIYIYVYIQQHWKLFIKTTETETFKSFRMG